MAKLLKKRMMPFVAVNDITILPGMVTHLDLTNKDTIQTVETAMKKDGKIVVLYRDGSYEDNTAVLAFTGTICFIKQILKMPGGIVRILLEGLERARVDEVKDTDEDIYQNDAMIAAIRPIKFEGDFNLKPEIVPVNEEVYKETIDAELEVESRISLLKESLHIYSHNNPQIEKEAKIKFDEAELASELIDDIAGLVPMEYKDRRIILEADDIIDGFDKLISIIGKYTKISNIKAQLIKKTKEDVEKNQRDYYLRRQLKVIKEQLDEGEDGGDDISSYKDQVKKLKASKEIKDRINKEIDRYERLHDGSSEAEVARGYIETLLAMPWDKMSKDNKDIDRAQQILDDDHYGLTKVKERVLEFLAVRNLSNKADGPIICLVGPPGTGKTSIAKSIAKALNKKYCRVCLGGVRDEAEIRGHRRTYVGALPGRIATSLKAAKVKNPLILLDEIDKMASDYKGDPASAMLEVLDPEQNVAFSDHYIELPIDLSEVLFIATANSASDIPRPLFDRMEIIEVNSYTENEKIYIAKDHLLPKVLERNGIAKDQLKIASTVYSELIDGYTREAGVRELERKLSQICQKAARMIYQDKKKSVSVNKSNLSDFLGKRKYYRDSKNDTDEIGIVRGLAWTRVGGDTLSIEVNVMPGKGEVILTGQLGDVMKESAQIGMSYVRSVAKNYGVEDKYFKENDFHIHIPEGSTPKDGPSAGITMATALLSAVTSKKVKCDVAMTGEITLRGKVLPIGGLKEKLLAAKNAGITKVLVPVKNEKDVDEIDGEITNGLKIVYVSKMEEVLEEALCE